MICLYTSEHPKGILDVNCKPENEHPFELMAYKISEKKYLLIIEEHEY